MASSAKKYLPNLRCCRRKMSGLGWRSSQRSGYREPRTNSPTVSIATHASSRGALATDQRGHRQRGRRPGLGANVDHRRDLQGRNVLDYLGTCFGANSRGQAGPLSASGRCGRSRVIPPIPPCERLHSTFGPCASLSESRIRKIHKSWFDEREVKTELRATTSLINSTYYSRISLLNKL